MLAAETAPSTAAAVPPPAGVSPANALDDDPTAAIAAARAACAAARRLLLDDVRQAPALGAGIPRRRAHSRAAARRLARRWRGASTY
jgi:hypothetical protein